MNTKSAGAQFTNTLFAIAFWFCLAGIAQAARIVTVEVQLGGKQVMGIARTDLGEHHAAVWQYLKTDRLSIERGYAIPVQKDDSRKAVLNGDLELRLVYGNRQVVARAKTDSITLVRAGPNSAEWFLAPHDVDRTMAIAGLELPVASSSPLRVKQQRISPTVWFGLAALAVAVFVAFSIRRRV